MTNWTLRAQHQKNISDGKNSRPSRENLEMLSLQKLSWNAIGLSINVIRHLSKKLDQFSYIAESDQ